MAQSILSDKRHEVNAFSAVKRELQLYKTQSMLSVFYISASASQEGCQALLLSPKYS